MEGSELGLLLIPDSPQREAVATAVSDAAVDGFVIYAAATNDPRVEAALARRVPVVTVEQPRDAPTSFIGIDDRAAARAAAEHLRSLGHERVGVVSFPSSSTGAERSRSGSRRTGSPATRRGSAKRGIRTPSGSPAGTRRSKDAARRPSSWRPTRGRRPSSR